MAQRSLNATSDPMGISARRKETAVVSTTDQTGMAVVGETWTVSTSFPSYLYRPIYIDVLDSIISSPGHLCPARTTRTGEKLRPSCQSRSRYTRL